MGKIVCSSCGKELDKVVLSFGTRSWDERTQSYIHTEEDEEGNWACPMCGAVVSEVRFYPPAIGRPFPKTYGDWVNLAENIKTATPDLDTQYTANLHLQEIATEGPNQDAAKRWLVEKAGELRIG